MSLCSIMSHCTWDALRGCSQENHTKKTKQNKAYGQTMSVSHIQQDALTIDPPFSWPFPMVPSRLHCRSDNRGDRRACSPSMSCCSLLPDVVRESVPKQRGHRLDLCCSRCVKGSLNKMLKLALRIVLLFKMSYVSHVIKHNEWKLQFKTVSTFLPFTAALSFGQVLKIKQLQICFVRLSLGTT